MPTQLAAVHCTFKAEWLVFGNWFMVHKYWVFSSINWNKCCPFHLITWSLDHFVLICIAYKEAFYLNTHASVFAARVGDDNCASVWSFSYYSAEDNDAMNSGDLNGQPENELNGKPENEN